MVECDEFRSILTYVNRQAEDLLPTSHNTIKAWSKAAFEQQKKVQIERIGAAKSKIHLWTDAWSSGNHLGMLATGATYLDGNYKLATVLLDLSELHGQHTGANFGAHWMRIIKEWQIQTHLGYVCMDNASNNDAGMRALSQSKCSLTHLNSY